MTVDFGHVYPLYARKFRQWNNPLIELAHQTYRSANRPITVVDVGAGVGDTVLLLKSNCQEMIGTCCCVEGDPEFFDYLRQNLGAIEDVRMFQAILSDTARPIPALRRTHRGSASAQGSTFIEATTLDTLISPPGLRQPCLLKTDVDGSDGKVLAGARNILEADRPTVIFEWHPILCQASGNNWLEHFHVLYAQGYRRFVWFTKYGHFSHFMYDIDERSIESLAQLCVDGRHDQDWHYDVVALTDAHEISEIAMAELSFAKQRRSRY